MQYGPKIVTDGLALSLDAADENSYSGSGSTITDLVTGNTGSIAGSPTFSSGSFHLNGTSNYWDISSLVSNIDFTSNEASVVIWLKLDVATPAAGNQTGIFNLSRSIKSFLAISTPLPILKLSLRSGSLIRPFHPTVVLGFSK